MSGCPYVRLGQPVPTLSGGEAQRLKLAGFLAEAAATTRQPLARKGTLFLFDEPTTGLHFDDIARLMRALRKLLDAGHSLLVIEHNLDVIRAADWIVDLGPEGGDAGGALVCCGTPEEVKSHPGSHTGRALCDYEAALGLGGGRVAQEGLPLQSLLRRRRAAATGAEAIRIVNAKEHNLRNLSIEVPRGRFNVVTGVSGSGKSTLAFDILFNEGQRRYLESLNAYARSIVQPAGRPEVDAVYGIPPTVAIEQRLSRGGRKSTVATTTEVWHFLRLLWVKLGLQHCVHDGAPVRAQSADSIAAQLLRDHRGEHVGLLAPLVVHRKGVYTDLAKWARARGPQPPARRRRVPDARALPAPGPLQGAHAGAAGGRPGGRPGARGRTARAALARPSSLAAACCTCCTRWTAWRRRWTTARAPPASARSRCSRPSAPARSAAPATPSWTRACSATTASMAGARAVSAPASR
jgi:excinuclease ABC subunit A